MKKFYVIILTFVFFTIGISSQEIIRVKATGKSSPSIKAASRARTMALRAAKVMGYKQLARAAGLEKFSKEGSKEYSSIQATLKNAKIVETNYISDHEVEVIMEVPLSDVIDTAVEIKKYRFNRKLLGKLQSKIGSIESDMDKLKNELINLKNLLAQLEEIAK